MKKEDWETLKVDRGVEIPKTKRNGGSPVAAKILELSPGDSFEVDKKHAQNVVNQFRATFGPNAYTSRSTGPNTMRFWRK